MNEATGAGDSFAAGFIYALSKGRRLRDAEYANACGARVVQVLGVTVGGYRLVPVINLPSLRISRHEYSHYSSSAHVYDETFHLRCGIA